MLDEEVLQSGLDEDLFDDWQEKIDWTGLGYVFERDLARHTVGVIDLKDGDPIYQTRVLGAIVPPVEDLNASPPVYSRVAFGYFNGSDQEPFCIPVVPLSHDPAKIAAGTFAGYAEAYGWIFTLDDTTKAIKLERDGGWSLAVDPSADTVTISRNGAVLLQVKGSEVVLGDAVGSLAVKKLVTEAFMTIYNTHTHASFGAPPAQLMTAAQLTSKTKAS